MTCTNWCTLVHESPRPFAAIVTQSVTRWTSALSCAHTDRWSSPKAGLGFAGLAPRCLHCVCPQILPVRVHLDGAASFWQTVSFAGPPTSNTPKPPGEAYPENTSGKETMMLELVLIFIPIVALVVGASVLDRKRRRRDGLTSNHIHPTVDRVRADMEGRGAVGPGSGGGGIDAGGFGPGM
jgi:hypothetical protein